MPNKLTDAEIKKALECCQQNNACVDCPMWKKSQNCIEILCKYALDLINRLQVRVEKAETVERFADKTIATLQAENEEHRETISSLEREIEKLYYELDLRIQEKRVVKAEARKEFAERLKAMLQSEASFSSMAKSIICENLMGDVDNLLIEMESKNNEQKDNC